MQLSVSRMTLKPNFPKMGRIGQVEGTRELVALANCIIVYQEDTRSLKILRILHAAQYWPRTS